MPSTSGNVFFAAILYINDSRKWPIQVLLRQVVLLAQGGIGQMSKMNQLSNVVIPAQSLKMAVIILSTVPILLIYPFAQKHFIHGMILGSIKG